VVLLPTTCPICRRPGPAPCPRCAADLLPAPGLPTPPGVDACTAVLAYDGTGRELVARLKYRNARSALRWLAVQMAAPIDPSVIDVVTWVPTTSARRRERGFDQAELLARAVARELGLPCRELVRRQPGPVQTGRGALERRRGPVVRLRVAAVPGRVLLVDDVVTTGTSVSVVARTLRGGGAWYVRVCAAARTSLKRVEWASEVSGDGPVDYGT
jgi:ComF family protein